MKKYFLAKTIQPNPVLRSFAIATVLVCTMITILTTEAQAEVFPSGGRSNKSIRQGEAIKIYWTNELDAPQIDVVLWNGRNGTYTTIANNVDLSIGEFSWQVPQNLPDGDRFRFIIRDAQRPHRIDYSMGFVTIGRTPGLVASIDQPSLPMHVDVRPNPANQICEVQWESKTADNIKVLDLSGRTVAVYRVEVGAQAAFVDVSGFVQGVYQLALMKGECQLYAAPLLINTSR